MVNKERYNLFTIALGSILTLFGLFLSIPIFLSEEYVWLFVSGLAVIIGVLIIAYELNK